MSEPKTKARPRGAQEYKGNGKHEWEKVTGDGFTQRLRVPGGWLFATGFDKNTAVVFVPVPEVVGYAV